MTLTGGYISCKITSFRIVIGAWCLLTLVLVNVYNGVLISYVTATRQTPPLINSIDDVATKSNIHIIVNKGQGPDIVLSVLFMSYINYERVNGLINFLKFMQTAKTGLYKALGDKLRAYPKSRCNATQDCVDLVKSLPAQHVYFSVSN